MPRSSEPCCLGETVEKARGNSSLAYLFGWFRYWIEDSLSNFRHPRGLKLALGAICVLDGGFARSLGMVPEAGFEPATKGL